MPRLAHASAAVRIKKSTQLEKRQIGEVHFCYPRIESGPADGLFGNLRRTHLATLGVLPATPIGLKKHSTEHETDFYERQCDVPSIPRPGR